MAIRFRRGNEADLDPTRLLAGEPVYCTDTKTIYVSNGDGTKITVGDMSNGSALDTFIRSFTATIAFFARTTAPNGWLVADGTAVSRTTYANLFAAIGTLYGQGDGSSTFNLPDLRGYFVRAWDSRSSGGVDNGRAFGSIQQDDFKRHAHDIYVGLSRSSSSTYMLDYDQNSSGITLSGGSTGSHNGIQYSGGTETRPQNIALLACIKY